MDIKKDPGKFTIRFCMADPRQKRAVEELNAQGRLKAQFLTNAILHYVEGTATLPPQEELESILERLMKRMQSRLKRLTAASHSALTTSLLLRVPCRRFADNNAQIVNSLHFA